MVFGGLRVLPSILILVLYIRNLVAIVDKKQPELQGVLIKDLGDGNDDPFQLDSLSAALSGENDGLNVISNLASSVPINFDPPHLAFLEQPTGLTATREIRINNPTHSLTLQLISISGNQPDFHSSFFVSKVLRPGESTTFEIVFLPRGLGPVEDTLLIQSSFGTYEYKVSGIGVQNMFRLRPLRGARIPINATYSPSIGFYNPYDSPLQIIELYSSGGSLHLELPHGFLEGNKTFWEIRPYETKQIARAQFAGQFISNHTAFIRIKTSHPSNPSIVLPVEVEVSEASGLFLSRELLDFGMIKSGGVSRLPLYILNAGPHQVEIKSVTPVPDNPAIKVEYTNTTLKPGNKYIKVAVLIFSVGAYPPTGEIEDSGMVKIWAEDKTSFHQLTVPYEALVLQGTLDYEPEDTLFKVHDPPFNPILRNITLSNRFPYPVVVYSAKLSSKAQEMFSVESFHAPCVIEPDGQWHDPIMLRFHPRSSECLLNTTLRLATNASFFNIPLICYDGSLEYDFGGKDVDALEFGLMTERDSNSKVFTIKNPNPVRISVTSIQVQENSNLPYVSVHLLSLPPQPRKHEILADGLKKGRRPPYYIDPGHRMIFSINISHPRRPGKFSGEILIYSSLGKVVTVPVNYQAVFGGVQILPKHIKFSPVFPYSTSSVRMHIKSTYTKHIKLVSLELNSSFSTNNDFSDAPQLPVILPSNLPVINPSSTTLVGEIVLDPLVYKDEFASTGYTLEDLSDTSSGSTLEKDLYHFSSLWEAWQSLIDSGLKVFNFTVTVDTEVDKGIAVPGTGSLEWPRLPYQSSSTLHFPLTLIGNTSDMTFSFRNPSSRPLQIEFLFLHQMSDPDHVLQTLSDKFSLDTTLYTNTTEHVYSIINHRKQSANQLTSYQKFPKITLSPHGNQSLELEFSPVSDQPTNGLMLLRNNLTIFDYIELKGTGSRGFITVGGVHPGGPSPLHFEYTQAMMDACTASETECGFTVHDPSYSKTFIVRNSGPTPVMVTGTLGDKGKCEDRGFHLTTCGKAFAVYPNRTRRIEIICSPDYTLSRITSSLHLTTPVGPPMDFPILATLPHNMLASCYGTVPHSDLESLASYLSVPLWLLALLVMVVATVFQVNWHSRRLHQTLSTSSSKPFGKEVPVQATGGPLFDLSGIAKRVSSSISEKVAELGKSVQEPMSPPVMPMTSSLLRVEESSFENEPLLPKEPKSLDPVRHSNNNKSLLSSVSRGTLGLHQTAATGYPPHSTDQQTGIQVKPNTSQNKGSAECGNEETKRITTDSLVETIQASSTPTKRSKAKRTFMKVEKSHYSIVAAVPPTTNPHLPDDSSHLQQQHHHQQQPLSLTTAVISVVKGEQFQRKESDDSIPESDQDQTGSTNGSEQSSVPSLTPDPEETTPPNISGGSTKLPSFTKEPGTGQTVPVKDGVEESEGVPVSDKPKASSHNPPPPSSTSVVSISVTATGKHRSKKKQRAQQKREEKLKKKRKEKEDVGSVRRVQEPQESFDKESVSSTNSMDNLEEDPPTSEQTTPEDEEERKPHSKVDHEGSKKLPTDKIKGDSEEKTVKPLKRSIVSEGVKEHGRGNEGAGPEDDDERSQFVEDTGHKDALVTSEPPPPPALFHPSTSSISDDVLVDEEAEMETSCSSIDFKAPALSPSPDELTTDTSPSLPTNPPSKSTSKKIKEVTEDSVPHSTVYLSTAAKGVASGKISSHPSSPETKPKNSSSSLPPTPGKRSTPAPAKPRPSKLILNERIEDQSQSSSVSSAETDGTSGRQRMPPHELAASLLKEHIPRPSKQKQDSTSEEKEPEVTSTANVPPPATTTTAWKKSSDSKHVDHGRDKRNNSHTPLSSEAIPFYPVPYLGHHHHPPHHLPHPPPISFPTRAPLLSSHPRHMPSPSYDYPMTRPVPVYHSVEDQIHPYDRADYERKHRKRSDPKYLPPKTFSPPSFPEGGQYHTRPSPFPQHNYDHQGEWVEPPHGGHMMPGYPDEDPLSLSYPSGHHRGGGYLHNPHNLPPYGLPPESSHHHVQRPVSMPMEGAESVWEHPGQLTPEELVYLKQRRLQKMREKQQQQLGNDLYDPLRHSSEPYSLASLRDRTLDPHSPSLYQGSAVGQSYGPVDMENESVMNDTTMMQSLDSQRRRRPSRESADFSLLLPSSAAAPGSLNRAPGPPGSFSEPVGRSSSTPSSSLSSLFRNDSSSSSSSISQQWAALEEETEQYNKPPPSSTSSKTSTWQTLWLMESPLLSAFEEQRQQAMKPQNPPTTTSSNTGDHNRYDLFEGNSRSIWSLHDEDNTLSWANNKPQ